MYISIIILSTINILFLGILIFYIRNIYLSISNTLYNTSVYDEELDEDDKREYTEEEMAIMARQEDFDRRMLRMQKEVEAYKASLINPKTGNIAEEIDGVKNLPHEEVQSYYDLYEEYAK